MPALKLLFIKTNKNRAVKNLAYIVLVNLVNPFLSLLLCNYEQSALTEFRTPYNISNADHKLFSGKVYSKKDLQTK